MVTTLHLLTLCRKDYAISDDNIFANDGRPNPEERMMRAQLLYYIATEIKRCKLSQRQAADLLGIPQLHVSLLLQAKLSNFSLERLLQMTARLGGDLAISGQLTNERGHITLNLPQFA